MNQAAFSSDRSSFINFLRGVAVFLMMWGHCIQYASAGQFDFFENTVFRFIYSFHMPFFMLISGYLFYYSAKKRDLPTLFEYKAKGLLYPILMCSLINYLLTTGVRAVYHASLTELTGGIQLDSLWFLWSVLSASLAMSLAVKLSENKLVQALLMIAGIGFALVFPWWQLNVYMYPYFILGYGIAKKLEEAHDDQLTSAKKRLLILCGVSFVIFLFLLFHFHKPHYIYTTGLRGGASALESLTIDLFRWGIGLAGSLFIVLICYYTYLWLKPHCAPVALWFENAGKDSLVIYALSLSLLAFYLPIITDKLLHIFPQTDWNRCIFFYNGILTPALAVCYTALIFWIIKLCHKLGIYRLLFGR